MWFNKEIRYATRSKGWSKVRKEHLINNPNCAACGRNKKLEVHHIIPVHISPDKELNLDNLITLCDTPCHIVFGHLMNYKSWNENVTNDCKIFYNKVKNKP